MLAQILAIAVAIGSGLLFITAFIFPKLHRQDDFFWSSVGFFYALVLWICAGQMTGAVLLGQLASIILLGWLAWEMLRLRQAIADPTKIPDLNKVSLIGTVKARFNKPKPVVPAKSKPEAEANNDATTVTPAPEINPEIAPEITPEAPAVETVAPELEETVPEPVIEPETPTTSIELDEIPATITEAIAPIETPIIAAPEIEISDIRYQTSDIEIETPAIQTPEIETPKKAIAPTSSPTKKGFSLGRFFGRKAETAPEKTNPQNLDDIFDDPDFADDEPTIESTVEPKIEPTIEPTAEPEIGADQSEIILKDVTETEATPSETEEKPKEEA